MLVQEGRKDLLSSIPALKAECGDAPLPSLGVARFILLPKEERIEGSGGVKKKVSPDSGGLCQEEDLRCSLSRPPKVTWW